jgi:hypothetical protein
MDDNSSSFVQLHRDDSGYGSPVLNREFLSPQQTSSNYYSYQHTYHPHMTYSNNSFHMYDQLISNNNNIYNSKYIDKQYSIEFNSLAIDSSIPLPLEQSSPLPVCTNSSSTPSNDSNICPPYEYKINWGIEYIKNFAKFLFLFS